MATVLLVDIDEAIEVMHEAAFNALNAIDRDADEVPDFIHGQVSGVGLATDAFLNYIRSNIKFAKWPKEEEDDGSGKKVV